MAWEANVPKTLLDDLEAFRLNEERVRRRKRAFGRKSGLIALVVFALVLWFVAVVGDAHAYHELGAWGIGLVAGLVAAFVAFLGVNVAFQDWRPHETIAVASGEVKRFERDRCHGAYVGHAPSVELAAADFWTMTRHILTSRYILTRYSPCVTMEIGVVAGTGEYEVLLSPVAAKALAGELARLADTY